MIFFHDDGYNTYLSLDASKDSIIAQSEIITELTSTESFVIVGRCADYILRNHKNLVTVFLYADEDYKINKVMEMYGDIREQAIEHIKKSNYARSTYYSLVANKVWGEKDNYDLYINANDTEENIVKQIQNFVNSRNKK